MDAVIRLDSVTPEDDVVYSTYMKYEKIARSARSLLKRIVESG